MGTWIQTHSGVAVDLKRPSEGMIRWDDIVWSLARMPRYTGHADRFYSVAEHCCRVSDWCRAEIATDATTGKRGDALLALAGLLHDAPEAYLGDLPGPLYSVLSPEARNELLGLHDRMRLVIVRALGLPDIVAQPWALVEEADVRILLDERDFMMKPPPKPWGPEERGMAPLGIKIECWESEVAGAELELRLVALLRTVASTS